jgi:hypothetical protein
MSSVLKLSGPSNGFPSPSSSMLAASGLQEVLQGASIGTEWDHL